MLTTYRTQITICVVLASLLLSGCQPLVLQDSSDLEAEMPALRTVQGEIYLPSVPEWGGTTVTMDFDFAELDPDVHTAAGYINWRNVIPGLAAGEPHWKAVESEVKYVFFGEDVPGQDPHCFAVLTQITDKQGWGEGQPGDYAYFWFRDGVDGMADQWGMKYYSFDPFAEFYPAAEAPVGEGYLGVTEALESDPVLPLDVETGGLTFTRSDMAAPAAELPGMAGARGINGRLFFPGEPEWGGVVITMEMDVTEIDPVTHAATGTLQWNNLITGLEDGAAWKRIIATPEYIFFGADVPGADPETAVLIARIESRAGPGQGEPGQHAYFWFRDAGEAADQWGMRYFSFDPWQEFYPADQPPVEEGYFGLTEMQAGDPALPLESELGDIVIY